MIFLWSLVIGILAIPVLVVCVALGAIVAEIIESVLDR